MQHCFVEVVHETFSKVTVKDDKRASRRVASGWTFLISQSLNRKKFYT